MISALMEWYVRITLHTSAFQMFAAGDVGAFGKPELGGRSTAGQSTAVMWALLETVPALRNCVYG